MTTVQPIANQIRESRKAPGTDLSRIGGFPGLWRDALARVVENGTMNDLWRDYAEAIKAHGVPNAENISNPQKWFMYVYFTEILATLVPDRKSRILDWGGLFGHLTQILRQRGYDETVNYILHKSDHYSIFLERFRIPTRYGSDANVFDLPSGSQDVFISSGVFEHVKEDGQGDEVRILREIHRVLDAGGWFFIWNLPTRFSLSEMLAKAANAVTGSHRYVHPYKFTRRQIAALLEAEGFKVEYIDKHGLIPGELKGILGRFADSIRIAKLDDRVSHIFPASFFANEWFIVARK